MLAVANFLVMFKVLMTCLQFFSIGIEVKLTDSDFLNSFLKLEIKEKNCIYIFLLSSIGAQR